MSMFRNDVLPVRLPIADVHDIQGTATVSLQVYLTTIGLKERYHAGLTAALQEIDRLRSEIVDLKSSASQPTA